MNKKLLIALLCAYVTVAFAQRGANAEYWNTFHYKAKDGMEKQFIEAAAKKTQKFNSSRDNLIVTYQITTGSQAGVYERIMPWQSSASYDLDVSKELSYWDKNVAPYAAPVGGQQVWQRMKWADVNIEEGRAPYKYLSKTTYIVKHTHRGHFSRFIARTGKIMEKRWPDQARILLRLHSGGQRNMFVSYVGFDTYEDPNKEPEASFEDMYNEMFGWGTFTTDLELYEASIEMIVGEQRETLSLVEALLPKMD